MTMSCKMPTLQLEDCLEDAPQTRSLLSLFEQDAAILSNFIQMMSDQCQEIVDAHKAVVSSSTGFIDLINNFKKQPFQLDHKLPTDVSESLLKCSEFLSQVVSHSNSFIKHVESNVLTPMATYLSTDMRDLTHFKDLFYLASQSHEDAMNRYSKLSKKKDNVKLRKEVEEEVFVYRKNFHRTALNYHSVLNSIQLNKTSYVLTPVLGYVAPLAQLFEHANDVCDRSGINKTRSQMSTILANCEGMINVDRVHTSQTINTLEKQAQAYYHPSQSDMSNPAAVSGYLYHKLKSAVLLGSKWERAYFFTQGSNLMIQHRDELGGRLAIDLDQEEVVIEPVDVDDRRFTFHIISTSPAAPQDKKTLTLQAENESCQATWMSALEQIVTSSAGEREAGDREAGDSGGGGDAGGDVKKGSPPVSPTRPAAVTNTGSVSHDVEVKTTGGLETGDVTIPAEVLLSTPIQFELSSPSLTDTDTTAHTQPASVSPFDTLPSDVTDSYSVSDSDKSFTVRFLGSMEVEHSTVTASIRHIVAARQMYNVQHTSPSHLVVRHTSRDLVILDAQTDRCKCHFNARHITYCGVDSNNDRLFGLTSRSDIAGHIKYICYVFECDTSAVEICAEVEKASSEDPVAGTDAGDSTDTLK